MKKLILIWFTALLFVLPIYGITIQLDYSYDTTSSYYLNAQQRSALQKAVNFYQNLINDHFSAITPGGSNTWSATFINPSDGVTTVTINNLSIPTDTIVIYAGGANLSGTTLGKGGQGGYSYNGSTAWGTTVRTRGRAGVDSNTNYALWGGSIRFDNSSRAWHNDPNTLPASGENDFYSVALHELGHVMGFGTSSSWQHYLSNGYFQGPHAVTAYGGNAIPVDSLSQHWGEGVMSYLFTNSSISQETAMDPSLTIGTRKELTILDVAALQDIGWSVIAQQNPWDMAGYSSSWAGAIYGAYWPWIYSYNLGWAYVYTPQSNDGFWLWFWNSKLGWVWQSPKTGSWVYGYANSGSGLPSEGWFYVTVYNGQRYLYVYNYGAWVTDY